MSNQWPPGGNPPGYGPPPQGYAQQPGYRQQQQGYGPPPQQGYGQPIAPYVPEWGGAQFAAAGPPTIFGVPLAPGERVVYSNKPNYTTEKVIWIVFGVLMIWAIIGIGFIIYGALIENWNPKAHVITTHRIIQINGKGPPIWMALNDAYDLEAERQRGGGGGLIGFAVRAIVNSMAAKNPKINPAYWRRTVAVILIARNGVRFRMKARHPEVNQLGPLLAQVILQPGWVMQLPGVGYEA